MTATDVMIDLETVGKKPGAPILSIGACTFNMSNNRTGPTFHQRLDLQSQFDKGLIPDASTIEWWMGQSDAARDLFKKKGTFTQDVLVAFATWLKQLNPKEGFYVWGNGSSFDISILEAVYNAYGITVPWKYNRIMDLRTYKRFVTGGAQIPRMMGTHHDALDDAVNQMEYVIKHNKIKRKKS